MSETKQNQANKTGTRHEERVQSAIERDFRDRQRELCVIKYKEYLRLIKQKPIFKDHDSYLIEDAVFDTDLPRSDNCTGSRTEFLLKSNLLNINYRIECKWQQEPGTTCDKLPATYYRLYQCPEKDIIIVLGGDKLTKGKYSWLKFGKQEDEDQFFNRALRDNYDARKNIHTVDLDGFYTWLNKGYTWST